MRTDSTKSSSETSIRAASIPLGRAAKAIVAGKESLLELVLPAVCRLCNHPVASSDDFCRSCETALTHSQPMMHSACFRCGVPKQNVTGDGLYSGRRDEPTSGCVHCRGSEFIVDGVAALWAYQDRVCDAVVAAKYVHQSSLGDALGRRLGNRVETVLSDDLPHWVTLVPSHVTRQFRRGGNGNQAIAEAVAKVIGRPCRVLLRTTRRIQKQAWLDDSERLSNVRGAFSLKKSYAFPRSPDIANRHILVVDDVLTTGATANEVARVLRDAGASRVSLAVVARAIRS